MKILAFAASTSKESINGKLIAYAGRILEEDSTNEVTILDLNDYEMPIFSVDRENPDGPHPLAQRFYNAIGAADAVIVSFAEHNGHYTAAYKNTFDWASRIDIAVYQGKSTVMLAASPGGGGGASALGAAMQSAQFFGNDVKASLSVPNFYDNFDMVEGALTNRDLDAQLRDALQALTA